MIGMGSRHSQHNREDEVCSPAERLLNACNEQVFAGETRLTVERLERRYSVTKELKLRGAPVFSGFESRVVPLLDACAELLRRDTQHEVVAVAIENVAAEGLTNIFIAVSHGGTDGGTDRTTAHVQEAKAHLETILDILRTIRRQLNTGVNQEGIPVTDEERNRNPAEKPISQLYSTCFSYSLPRWLRWFDKAHTLFERLSNAQREDLTKYQVKFVDTLLAMQKACVERKMGEVMKLLVSANTQRKQEFLGDITFLKYIQTSDEVDFPKMAIEERARLVRLADKLLSLEANIRCVLQLAVSKPLGVILDNRVDVVAVAREWEYLNFDHSTDSYIREVMSKGRPMKHKSFVKEMKKYDAASASNVKWEVHAECALFAKILDKEGDGIVFPYIGMSKMCCAGCWLFIEAYNHIAKQKYFVRGSHGRLCRWVAPKMKMKREILDSMLRAVRILFLNLTPMMKLPSSSGSNIITTFDMSDYDFGAALASVVVKWGDRNVS